MKLSHPLPTPLALAAHLPFSETEPTPLNYLGHISGAPDILSYPAEVHGYMRALAAASPRVEVLLSVQGLPTFAPAVFQRYPRLSGAARSDKGRRPVASPAAHRLLG